ncbi:MAG: haloacid dehalogenase-like hydrolase [Clostridia bacterium]|nr:haloacid dehalogenase-like hydrolase [Clostridia bacterium]
MNRKPIIALMYDFDNTLCTKNMQEYTFIPEVGMTTEEFWKESNSQSREKNMDGILSYMYVMLERAKASKKSIRKEAFMELGKDLEYYPGVTTWFSRINEIGRSLGAQIEHYIISSGLREIIEGSKIFHEFKEVFGCEFLYDENGIACWPKNAVNYTTKTQFIFRINKGVLDISNDYDLNRFTPERERRVLYHNMIYIGDGLTDVPCMKLVKLNGGQSIAVYKKDDRKTCEDLLSVNRVNFIEPADYRKGKPLEKTVTEIIQKMVAQDVLLRKSKEQFESLYI